MHKNMQLTLRFESEKPEHNIFTDNFVKMLTGVQNSFNDRHKHPTTP